MERCFENLVLWAWAYQRHLNGNIVESYWNGYYLSVIDDRSPTPKNKFKVGWLSLIHI